MTYNDDNNVFVIGLQLVGIKNDEKKGVVEFQMKPKKLTLKRPRIWLFFIVLTAILRYGVLGGSII